MILQTASGVSCNMHASQRASIASLAVIFLAAPVTAGSFCSLHPQLGYAEDSLATVQRNWELFGNATLHGQRTSISLTTDGPDERGAAVCRQIITVNDDASGFTADVTVRMDGAGVSLAGDGMAVLFVADEVTDVGTLLGGPSSFSGLGIFIDTFDRRMGLQANMDATRKRPYITAALNDGSLMFADDEYTTTLHKSVGCYAPTIRDGTAAGTSLTLRVKWERATGFHLTYVVNKALGDHLLAPAQQWIPCLTIPEAPLPPQSHLVISASTSDVTDAHDVLAVGVETNDPRRRVDARDKSPQVAAVPLALEQSVVELKALREKVDRRLTSTSVSVVAVVALRYFA